MKTTRQSWKNIFCTSHHWYGYITVAYEAARNAKYPFMEWNGRVYAVGENGPIDTEELVPENPQ